MTWEYADKMKADRVVDPEALDVEAARQADLFYDWAKLEVELEDKAERLGHECDVMAAKIEVDARQNPEDYGLGPKSTEAAVKAAVLLDKRWAKKRERYFDAKRDASLAKKARYAMEQKKRMIEVLITLHGQEYFAGPSVPRNLKEAWAAHRAAQADAVNTKQRGGARRRFTRDSDDVVGMEPDTED